MVSDGSYLLGSRSMPVESNFSLGLRRENNNRNFKKETNKLVYNYFDCVQTWLLNNTPPPPTHTHTLFLPTPTLLTHSSPVVLFLATLDTETQHTSHHHKHYQSQNKYWDHHSSSYDTSSSCISHTVHSVTLHCVCTVTHTHTDSTVINMCGYPIAKTIYSFIY